MLEIVGDVGGTRQQQDIRVQHSCGIETDLPDSKLERFRGVRYLPPSQVVQMRRPFS